MDILRELKERYGFVLVVDATFATPVNQQPLKQGADVVLHSATKYLGGHNDLLGGAALGRRDLIELIRDYRNTTGGGDGSHDELPCSCVDSKAARHPYGAPRSQRLCGGPVPRAPPQGSQGVPSGAPLAPRHKQAPKIHARMWRGE